MLYTSSFRPTSCSQFVCIPFQYFLDSDEDVGLEDSAENPLPFVRLREQKLHEVSLSYHGYLGELRPVYSKYLIYLRIHVLESRNRGAVRQEQGSVGILQRHSFASFLRPFIRRITFYQIGLPVIFEFKLDKGRGLFVRIFGTEHPAVPVRTARLSVQCECYRIEDGCLSCSRISGNKVKPLSSEKGEVYFNGRGVWPECRHGKFQRSHLSPSINFSITPFRYSSC